MKKIKNRIIVFIAFLMSIIAMNSCVDSLNVGDNFLDKQPGVELPLDKVFSKAEYARYYLWSSYKNLYCALDRDMINEALSDSWHSVLGWDDNARVYYPGTYNADNEGAWVQSRFGYRDRLVWETVRSCWIFIENIDRVPDMTAEEKARLAAEAKIIIASRYFDLFRNAGGLPIIDHMYEQTETYNAPRATVEETVNFMIKMLDEAAATPSLPWNIPDSEIQNWAGRLTKASAMGLKCKILLTAASPIFNDTQAYSDEAPQEAVQLHQVWYGSFKQELWTQCLKACEDFFAENNRNGTYYKLIESTGNTLADYRAAYRKGYWTRGNSEKIIEVHNRYKQAEWDQGPGIGNISHTGAAAPTLEFMEMFPWANGKAFNADDLYGTDNPNNINIFEDRDPRLYETLLVQKKDFMWQGRQVEIWEGGNIRKNVWFGSSGFLAHGMGIYKWILDYWDMANEPYQWPYLRMAEMHLIYAEALAETNNLPLACAEVNKVRARVGLPKIETSNPTLNLTSDKKNMINEILRERACELGMEDTRLHDMVRRKLVNNFTKPLHGIKIFRKDGINEPLKDGESYPSAFKYEKYEIAKYSRAWWKPGFWKNKWLLNAMPIMEINKDYGLTQNPGW